MRGLILVILSWLKKPEVTRRCIHSKKTISFGTRYIKIITFVFKFKRIASVMKKQDVKKKNLGKTGCIFLEYQERYL